MVPKLPTACIPSSMYLPFSNTSLPICAELGRGGEHEQESGCHRIAWACTISKFVNFCKRFSSGACDVEMTTSHTRPRRVALHDIRGNERDCRLQAHHRRYKPQQLCTHSVQPADGQAGGWANNKLNTGTVTGSLGAFEPYHRAKHSKDGNASEELLGTE